MTASDLYCSRSDVTRRLPPGALMTLAGLTVSAVAATGTITYDGHGLETNDPITVRPLPDAELPEPLVSGTTYYAIRLNNSDFQLAATVDGPSLGFATDSAALVVARDPDFDMWIEFYSRWADLDLQSGHVVPMGRDKPVPKLVRGLVADLVAERMFNISGQPSTEAMKALEIATSAQLARFAAGVPVRDVGATASANMAIVGSSESGDPRGYGSTRLP